MTLAQFNRIREAEARAALRECCGSTAWVGAMVARRPFATESDLLDAADDLWWKLKEADWQEAFGCHPQIGANGSQQRWSKQEQSGMKNVREDTRRDIHERNFIYLEKFGYIYIVCATGKASEEMLAALKERLHNDPATEIRIAAKEQSKITRLRLSKMLST